MISRHDDQQFTNLETYNMFKTDEQLEKQSFLALILIVVVFALAVYFVFIG